MLRIRRHLILIFFIVVVCSVDVVSMSHLALLPRASTFVSAYLAPYDSATICSWRAYAAVRISTLYTVTRPWLSLLFSNSILISVTPGTVQPAPRLVRADAVVATDLMDAAPLLRLALSSVGFSGGDREMAG